MWGTCGEYVENIEEIWEIWEYVAKTSRPVVVGPCVAPRSWRLVNTEETMNAIDVTCNRESDRYSRLERRRDRLQSISQSST